MAIGGKAGESFSDINVTPLTDVFLVLLVIMILIAPLVNQTVLKVDPPQQSSLPPKTPPPPDKDTIKVEISAAGVVTINGSAVQPADSLTIQQRISAAQQKAGNQDIPLDLQCDADAIQKFVVAVMDAASGAGIKRMHVLPLKSKPSA